MSARGENMQIKPLIGEFLGTFVVVLALAGSWIFAPQETLSPLAIGFSVGLAIMAMSYAIGHVSGGHFNPAVTVGLIVGGRFDTTHAPGYIIGQVLGGIAAIGLIAIVLWGRSKGAGAPDIAELANTYASTHLNTPGSRGGFSLLSVFITEGVLSAVFILVVLGATAHRDTTAHAPLAIGGMFALLYIIAMPISNAGLNPARSTAVAIFAGTEAIAQLWVFWLAPLAGAIAGGALGRWLLAR